MNVRRTIGFIATVVLLWVSRGVYDYTPDLRERLTESPWESLGLLVLTIVAIAALVWAVTHPSPPRTVLAFGLGFGTALWGQQLLEGIGWAQTGSLLGVIAGLALLYFVTTWDEIQPIDGWINR